jgi:hypothetical protein
MHRHGPSCLPGPASRRRWVHKQQESRTMSPPPNERPPEDAPIRWELVERARRAIADGTYDTPEKMEVALQRLLEQTDAD